MMHGLRFAAAAFGVALLAGAQDARAADLSPAGKILVGTHQLTLVCDNGRSYPIRARAVTEVGELVTGYIQTSPNRSHHFRLIPMGTGYRYAGYGFWFDGVRNEATLYVDSRQAACTVEQAV